MSDEAETKTPAWARYLFGLSVTIVLSVIGTIGWLDGKYVTKHELELVRKDISAITEIKDKLDKVSSAVTDLRILLASAVAADKKGAPQ